MEEKKSFTNFINKRVNRYKGVAPDHSKSQEQVVKNSEAPKRNKLKLRVFDTTESSAEITPYKRLTHSNFVINPARLADPLPKVLEFTPETLPKDIIPFLSQKFELKSGDYLPDDHGVLSLFKKSLKCGLPKFKIPESNELLKDHQDEAISAIIPYDKVNGLGLNTSVVILIYAIRNFITQWAKGDIKLHFLL
jgi:hypothetical protein